MFRIRQVSNDSSVMDRNAIAQVIALLKEQFPDADPKKFDEIPEVINNPFRYQFRLMLFVADSQLGNVFGAALLFHAPIIRFCYLDYIATCKGLTSRGIGGALYQRVREEAKVINAVGIFFECLPDDPSLCSDQNVLKQNSARLKFYESFGAFPIVNTKYETPVKPSDSCPPYIVFDPLGGQEPLQAPLAKQIIRAILERKYKDYCPKEYVDMVVKSIADNPVKLRDPLYIKGRIRARRPSNPIPEQHIALVINQEHSVHHVKARGYVEAPVRIPSILKELDNLPFFKPLRTNSYPDKLISETHDHSMVSYLKAVCEKLGPDKAVYPYVFPVRNAHKPPKDRSVAAGYYCIDTFTPLTANSYKAARRAVDCALTAANHVITGKRVAYALVRPPGHHAERRVFGGFCYFNSAAIAANMLSKYGRVAMLDIDYHHGNGQQDIFYHRADVLTISTHGHPAFAYPYFSGFRNEVGVGEGVGYNINYPLPEHTAPATYLRYLKRAVKHIDLFKPKYLIILLGLDTAKGDPTGTWALTATNFEENGMLLGALKLPTLVVQEGGYRTRSLGVNAAAFFKGLHKGFFV